MVCIGAELFTLVLPVRLPVEVLGAGFRDQQDFLCNPLSLIWRKTVRGLESDAVFLLKRTLTLKSLSRLFKQL